MATALKTKILSGVFWQGLERVGSQGISFVISVLLARLLAPEAFGVIAVMLVFISLCDVFVDSGFGAALIQKKDMTEADCSSVFFINIAVALLMYGILFCASPWIARFYATTELELYLRVLALTLIIRAFSVVQNALLHKKMLFYLSFRISWAALLVSGSAGIALAYRSFGVWALIAQRLTNAVVTTFLLWVWVKWRPQRLFDWKRTLALFQFGWKLFVSSILDTLYNDIYSLTIGKIADLTTLSFYNRGKTIPQLGIGVVNSTLGNVMFPAFAKLQGDSIRMRQLAKCGLQNTMFAVIPALTLLFILAEPLVKLLLTEKWLPCVPFLRLCTPTFLFWPFHTINLQIINACGRSDVFLVLEIIKKCQAAVVIFITYRFGVMVMVAAWAAMGLFMAFENGWMNGKFIGYAPWSQLSDVLPLLLIGVFSGGLVGYGLHVTANPWMQIVAGGAALVTLYLFLCTITHRIPAEVVAILKPRRNA